MRFCLLLVAAGLLVGCSSTDSTESVDALDQASVTFQGMPSRVAVKSAMDKAFAATGLMPSEENYSRAGSALVTQQEAYGAAEMKILACIPRHVNDPRVASLEGEPFVKASALCALIVSGKYPSRP